MKSSVSVKVIFLLAAVVFLCCCGKKGPPFIPQKAFPLKISNLKGGWSEGKILLAGDLEGPRSPEEARGSITGCRVYYGEFPPQEAPCADCPIAYQGYDHFGPEVITGERFSCNVPGKTEGQVLFFKVYLLGPDGRMGPPSNTIQIAPEGSP
ncbi:MAG: hypothetical protein ACOWYE_04350 [Desulfatiglandales bacterium]